MNQTQTPEAPVTTLSKKCFIRKGDAFIPDDSLLNEMYDHLPAGYYVVKASLAGLYFEEVEAFTMPTKLYGDVEYKADRIINTFHDRPAAMGTLLTGEKGCGKTQLARVIGHKFFNSGFPVIIVNAPFNGDGFNKLIQSIEGPALILFDEFEKVYDDDQQQGVLTLLDGVFPTKKLFLFTVNNKYKVNEFMRNRPGRIYYMLEFRGLPREFIEEYCQDNLNDKEHIPAVIRISSLFQEFNFDTLKALVEEMNRYNESPIQALAMLNAKPEQDASKYDISIVINGVKLDSLNVQTEYIYGTPIGKQTIDVWYTPPIDESTKKVEGDEEDDRLNEVIKIVPGNLTSMDSSTSSYVFKSKEDINGVGVDWTVTFTRQKHSGFEYSDYIGF